MRVDDLHLFCRAQPVHGARQTAPEVGGVVCLVASEQGAEERQHVIAWSLPVLSGYSSSPWGLYWKHLGGLPGWLGFANLSA